MNCFSALALTFAEVFGVMKTTRCGDLSAFDSIPASNLLFVSLMTLPNCQATILLNAPEVDRDKPNCQQRQDDAVQHIEPQQRVLAHKISAQQQVAELRSKKRR